ncbi:MAG: S1-like domain-containing RNA-binding protein [Methyloglobulus sp.]|nr:GntR family transcriptional regulator [Methyloglobulus sp.]
MIEIGKVNHLKIVSCVGSSIYLASKASAKVLLIDKKPPENSAVGDELDVFVYVDTEGHLAATTIIPKALVDEIAWLKVVSLNYVGAFLDWGLPKDLLVPFSEQHHELEVGKSYLVKLFLDSQNRILATTKIDKFIADEGFYFKTGQEVSLLIADKTDLGIKAIINNTHWGMLYQNELFQSVTKGQKLTGFIKQIREDHKIDLSLHKPGYGKVEELSETILIKLKANNGFLPLTDKSPPETIYSMFGVSKKVFKQAIGALYKKKSILLEKDSIRLIG